jgi:hypothetical protein
MRYDDKKNLCDPLLLYTVRIEIRLEKDVCLYVMYLTV